MTIFSLSRSRDRKGQCLRRRRTSLPKTMTRPPPPHPLVDLALLLQITRLPSSRSPVYHHPRPVFCPQSGRKITTSQLKSPLLRALRASSGQLALRFPEAAAATAMLRILLFPLRAVLSFFLVLWRGAATAVAPTVAAVPARALAVVVEPAPEAVTSAPMPLLTSPFPLAPAESPQAVSLLLALPASQPPPSVPPHRTRLLPPQLQRTPAAASAAVPASVVATAAATTTPGPLPFPPPPPSSTTTCFCCSPMRPS